MAFNERYNFFAEFIDMQVPKEDFQNLIKEFRQDIYTQAPSKIIDRVDEFFRDKWIANADASPIRGNAQTQFNNFQKFIHSTILTREKLTFKDPYLKGKMIDWSPVFTKYKEATREIIRKPTGPIPTAPKVVKLLRPEIIGRDNLQLEINAARLKGGWDRLTDQQFENLNNKQLKDLWYEYQTPIASSEFKKKLSKSINKYSKNQNVSGLLTIRDSLRDMVFYPDSRRPINSFEARELYNKVSKQLDPYMVKGSRLGSKPNRQLLNSLVLEGIDVSKLTTSKEIKEAAKNAGIGLRKYQKNRNELIDEIRGISPKYSKNDLQNSSTNSLAQLRKSLKVELTKPKKPFYVRYSDLPVQEERVAQVYESKGLSISPEVQSSIRSEIKTARPYLTKSEVDKELNRRLVSNLPDVPVFSKELEKRFMNEKYGDPTRAPTYSDLLGLSRLTHKDFRKKYATETTTITDPTTGKKKKVKDTLPKNAFKQYRDSLKNSLMRDQNVSKFYLKKELPAKQLEQVERFEVESEEAAVEEFLGEFE